MHYLAPIPKQFVDESGVPCTDGTVSVYTAGTMVLAEIYQNAYDDELAENPATLDSCGRWVGYVDSGIALDYVVKDREGNVIATYSGVLVEGSAGGSDVTKAYVDAQDDAIRESVGDVRGDVEEERSRAELAEQSIADSVEAERSRAESAEAAATTEVIPGNGIRVNMTEAQDGHRVYEVENVGIVDIELVSPKSTIGIRRREGIGPGTVQYELDVTSVETQEWGRFTQASAVADSNGSKSYDGIERTEGTDGDISVYQGRLNLERGLYHATLRIDVTNVAVDGNYYGAGVTILGRTVSFVFDNSFIHTETVELSADLYINAPTEVVPTVQGLPPDSQCPMNGLEVHKVSASGAEGFSQIPSDWNQTDSSQPDYIFNKPQNLVQDPDYVHTDNNYTDADKGRVNAALTEIDQSLSTDSANPVENRAVANAMNGKQDTLTEMTDEEIDDLLDSLNI